MCDDFDMSETCSYGEEVMEEINPALDIVSMLLVIGLLSLAVSLFAVDFSIDWNIMREVYTGIR